MCSIDGVGSSVGLRPWWDGHALDGSNAVALHDGVVDVVPGIPFTGASLPPPCCPTSTGIMGKLYVGALLFVENFEAGLLCLQFLGLHSGVGDERGTGCGSCVAAVSWA